MTLIKDPIDHSLSIAATAMMTVDVNMSGTVNVCAEAVDGRLPRLLVLSGDRELMDAACLAEHVQLDLLGLKICTVVAAQAGEPGSILVEAQPLFRELAINLEALSYD